MPDLTLRPAVAKHLPAINAIYNHYVPYCTSALRDVPMTPAERKRWFTSHDAAHPVIVAVADDMVVGFAAASPCEVPKESVGVAEDTVFVKRDAQGRGVGSSLLKELLVRAKAAGHHAMIATIAANQSGMIRLREAHGYVEEQRLTGGARKFGKSLDLVVMRRVL